ncbi:hypothetical protein GOB91_29285 [Sinorhizobium meliloti]|nr:hypothetical protein [Sinorhizobium meliloti]MDW9732649.1 hypothetical protein [Sinorhizobium meliloti]
MKIVNPWAWWQEALKGNFGPMHEGQPEQGYYRTRFKGGQWEPVAIYYPEGSEQMVAYRGRKEVDPAETWNFCRTHPISYEAYMKALEGNGFDDEPPLATIGDNSGSEDPFEAIMQELAGEKEMADEFLRAPVNTQADADKAGIWAKRLSDLAKRADNLRVVEKEPHLAASRAVDDKWRAPVGQAKDLSVALKLHVEPFLKAKKREEEERARKAAAEAAELRRKADEAARKAAAETSQKDAASQQKAEQERQELLRQAEAADKAAEVKNAQAGRTGAKVSIRVEKVGVVTDYAKAAAALVAMKHKDLIEIIDKLAQRAAKAGMPFDGMDVKEEERVV